jgi:membrane protein involved in colicin uptake
VDEIHQLVRRRVRDVLPISARRRVQLKERLTEEEQSRERRAAAEAEVLRMDADLRARRMSEARLREESRRRAREEAERQLQEEAERELRTEEGRRIRDTAERRATAAASEVDAISAAAEAIGRAAAPTGTVQLPAADSSAAERAAAAALASGSQELEPRGESGPDDGPAGRRGRHR